MKCSADSWVEMLPRILRTAHSTYISHKFIRLMFTTVWNTHIEWMNHRQSLTHSRKRVRSILLQAKEQKKTPFEYMKICQFTFNRIE